MALSDNIASYVFGSLSTATDTKLNNYNKLEPNLELSVIGENANTIQQSLVRNLSKLPSISSVVASVSGYNRQLDHIFFKKLTPVKFDPNNIQASITTLDKNINLVDNKITTLANDVSKNITITNSLVEYNKQLYNALQKTYLENSYRRYQQHEDRFEKPSYKNVNGKASGNNSSSGLLASLLSNLSGSGDIGNGTDPMTLLTTLGGYEVLKALAPTLMTDLTLAGAASVLGYDAYNNTIKSVGSGEGNIVRNINKDFLKKFRDNKSSWMNLPNNYSTFSNKNNNWANPYLNSNIPSFNPPNYLANWWNAKPNNQFTYRSGGPFNRDHYHPSINNDMPFGPIYDTWLNYKSVGPLNRHHYHPNIMNNDMPYGPIYDTWLNYYPSGPLTRNKFTPTNLYQNWMNFNHAGPMHNNSLNMNDSYYNWMNYYPSGPLTRNRFTPTNLYQNWMNFRHAGPMHNNLLNMNDSYQNWMNFNHAGPLHNNNLNLNDSYYNWMNYYPSGPLIRNKFSPSNPLENWMNFYHQGSPLTRNGFTPYIPSNAGDNLAMSPAHIPWLPGYNDVDTRNWTLIHPEKFKLPFMDVTPHNHARYFSLRKDALNSFGKSRKGKGRPLFRRGTRNSASSNFNSIYGPFGHTTEVASLDNDMTSTINPNFTTISPDFINIQHQANQEEAANAGDFAVQNDFSEEFNDFSITSKTFKLLTERVDIVGSQKFSVDISDDIIISSTKSITLDAPNLLFIGKVQNISRNIEHNNDINTNQNPNHVTQSQPSQGGGFSPGGTRTTSNGKFQLSQPTQGGFMPNAPQTTGATAGNQSVPTLGSGNPRDQAMSYFMAQGWTKEQAAGIVGNLQVESNFDPHIQERGGSNHWGIAQWDASRQAQFASLTGKDLRTASLAEQLWFVNWELNHSHKSAGNALRNSKTVSQATDTIFSKYEVAGDSSGPARQAMAMHAFNSKIDASQTQSTTPTQALGSDVSGSAGPLGAHTTVRKGTDMDNVNPKLKAVMDAAVKDLPAGFTVEAISGHRPFNPRDPTKNHPNGLAIDYNIYDANHNLIPNDRVSSGAKYYEMLAQSMVIRGKKMYPDEKFIWGANWHGGGAPIGGDLMHYQIVDPTVKGSAQSGAPEMPGVMTKAELQSYRDQVIKNMSTPSVTATNTVAPNVVGNSPLERAKKLYSSGNFTELNKILHNDLSTSDYLAFTKWQKDFNKKNNVEEFGGRFIDTNTNKTVSQNDLSSRIGDVLTQTPTKKGKGTKKNKKIAPAPASVGSTDPNPNTHDGINMSATWLVHHAGTALV